MPRLPRLDLPGIPQHVVQRGHDRLPCFAAEVDYMRYRQELLDAAPRHGCAIHAYVLMTNHVHLLVSPATEGAVSRMMQMLGRRYVGGFNARYRRSGTLWEGRFKSCLVDSEDYLLRCYRYIELNPVRARMVEAPGQYPWSSYAANALGRPDHLVTPHPAWLALDHEPDVRRARYAEWVSENTDAEEAAEIRVHLRQGKAYGSQRFRRHIEALVGRCAEVRQRGRPRLNPREK